MCPAEDCGTIMERCSINYMCPYCHSMLNGESLPDDLCTSDHSVDVNNMVAGQSITPEMESCVQSFIRSHHLTREWDKFRDEWFMTDAGQREETKELEKQLSDFLGNKSRANYDALLLDSPKSEPLIKDIPAECHSCPNQNSESCNTCPVLNPQFDGV